MSADTGTSFSAIGGASRPAPERWIAALAGVALLAAVAVRIVRTDGEMLWLDELYTTTLIGADSLGRLWDGIALGLDGNPPLYMTVGWLATHALGLPAEPALRTFNLLLGIATAAMLYRISRRFGDPGPAVLALLMIAAVETVPIFVVLELRTYGLYLAAVSASLLLAVRLAERPAAAGRCWSFAAAACVATASHTFGGVYVLAVTAALATVAAARRDGLLLQRSLVGCLPAAILLLCWLRLVLPAMAAVSSPYGWITRPGLNDLAASLSGSFVISAAILAGGTRFLVARRAALPTLPGWLAEPHHPAVLAVAITGFAALTAGAWIASQVITPFFTLRYFTPNLIIATMVLTGFFTWMRPRVRPRLLVVLAVLALLGTLTKVGAAYRGAWIPCLESDGTFLEESVAAGQLPVVLESPHSWLPRHSYARGYRTLYALDWDVVLNYPEKGRNNATDYNLMRILRDWVGPGDPKRDDLLTTEQILARYPSFLVVNESGRSWFDNLRATRPVAATLLKEGDRCKVWRVDQRP